MEVVNSKVGKKMKGEGGIKAGRGEEKAKSGVYFCDPTNRRIGIEDV